MKVILVTGASGGIGEAIVNRLAERKHNLLLIARNGGKLEKQCSSLAEKFGIHAQYIAADLSKPETAAYILQETERRNLEIEMLVNNAGIGSGGEFSTLALQSELDLLQLNISSLVALTHLFLPQMKNRLAREYQLPIDNFSQDVIIANLEVLLSYCNRYYNRQFITRKVNNGEVLSKAEHLLNLFFEDKTNKGLPTAGYLATELNLSTKYLNDCIKQLTEQTTQQLIHEKVIEQAKDYLTTTELSISEIAYQLGFEYPQSFSKLFKNKTSQTPVRYRQSFN